MLCDEEQHDGSERDRKCGLIRRLHPRVDQREDADNGDDANGFIFASPKIEWAQFVPVFAVRKDARGRRHVIGDVEKDAAGSGQSGTGGRIQRGGNDRTGPNPYCGHRYVVM